MESNRRIIGGAPGRGEADMSGAAESNWMIEVTATDGAEKDINAKVLWKAKKAMATSSSSVAYQGVGYWGNRAGDSLCN
ncbi:MAG TPA: hypothetical protein DDZ51_17045 [Planctomycetaceae bacterium]|nr:hypothetical protein [Planctomycetaceae bacterium]